MVKQTPMSLPIISSGPNVHVPRSQDPIIGIDLGTTNSLVAIVENGIPRIIQTSAGVNLLPSAVYFHQDGSIEIGQRAKNERLRFSNQTVFSVKRLLGRGSKDIKEIQELAKYLPYNLEASTENNILIRVGSRSYTPIEISAMILKELKSIAENDLGRPVEDVVITVPAYFNDSQRQATRVAGRIAGLNVLRILNEPTAAALAYGLQEKKNGLIAVYDLGGGTFDISILRLHDGIFEVLATNGDTQLGGDDIDQAISEWILSTALPTYPQLGFLSQDDRATLLEFSERLKIELATQTSVKSNLKLQSIDLFIDINRSDLEKLLMPLLEKTLPPVLGALKDSGIEKSDLSDVVLVGGPTRLDCIQKFVEKTFGMKPNTSVHPDEVVAIGAAIQADILAGNNKDALLLDVVPLSLGIETFGGAFNRLIQRNSRIPIMVKEQFTTYTEGQTKVAINVYQGERELVSENRKLAEFALCGIPPLAAGLPRIEVTFMVDADGILSVSAKELYSSVEQSVEVRPMYGLSDQEVEKMLSEGIENKDKDTQMVKAIDAKNDAKVIMHASQKGIDQVRHLLSKQEVQEVEALIEELKRALLTDDISRIKSANEALNSGTTHMAEVLMTATLQTQVKNKKSDDILKKI